MVRVTTTSSHFGAMLILLGALQFSAGCLYGGDPGSTDGEMGTQSMEGVLVELIRHTTRCGAERSDGIIAEVGPDVEYAGDIVKSIDASCEGAPTPPIEIYLDGRSITFDFAEVDDSGEFPEGAFDGYILDIVGGEQAPLLVHAEVDQDVTNVAFDSSQLEIESGRIEIDFSGVRFDATSFLRVELYLASATARATAP